MRKTPENLRALAVRLVKWEEQFPGRGGRKKIIRFVMEFTGKSYSVAYAWIREARVLIIQS